jgi:signal transduction histidine kinase
VSPASIIQKNLGFFTEQATAKNLTIKLEVKAEIEITANPELTDILINNLFLNAIKHNIPGGEIIILINKDGILFRNTGNNYPLQKENLFKRFSKTNPSHQGNGLGLSLIKKIADINSWKITYTYEKRYHSFFILF